MADSESVTTSSQDAQDEPFQENSYDEVQQMLEELQ